ncbi:Arsenate-mycothiol transferase ArsC2 [Planctomycetes bacterium Pan216]|uniref:Arsenate-mycothiol transferase ArsC2 n=1 Tax=Kolteria novifilia TaxID=2527975 RepID=A0A518B032_9BACT|nr:Arsenate-mycothiol transferase ArsC2 [Planctomycetes bacterium Pan216]
MSKRVLILCTGNSCRSQMAEGLWREIAAGTWEAASAGSQPSGYVHPLAIEVMNEVGIDISGQTSKSVVEYQGESFDLVITVCDNAKESCPVFPSVGEVLHWPFEDPASASGSEEEKREFFQRVRDQIGARIEQYLAEKPVA